MDLLSVIVSFAVLASVVIDLVALGFLIKIWKDDRAMRIASEKTLKIQEEYLGLRRKWYEQRSKKKEEKNVPAIENTGTDTNTVRVD
jgi:hypothetical protein